MDRNDTPRLTTAQIRVGDFLIRAEDYLGRPNCRYRVSAILRQGVRQFQLDGYWSQSPQTAKSLSAENITQVERDGQIIGHFFVSYW